MELLNHLSQFAACNNSSFFGLPHWGKYLKWDGSGADCRLADSINFPNDIWLIAAAVFEILLHLGAIMAVVFIIWGGFNYITSGGNPESAGQARKTIINALIGLTITVIAAVAVAYITRTITNTTSVGAGLPEVDANKPVFVRVLKVVYAIAGSVSAVMIVIGGIRFVTSSGSPDGISRAKNTIIYALVGLVVVLLAFGITDFVLSRIES